MKFTKSPVALAAITVLAGAPLAAEAVSVNFRAPSSGTVLSNVTWNQSSACEVTGSDIRRVQFVLINSSGNTISQLWSGTLTTSGSSVTVKNLSWNGSLNAGQSAQIGFLGTGSTTFPAVTCTSP